MPSEFIVLRQGSATSLATIIRGDTESRSPLAESKTNFVELRSHLRVAVHMWDRTALKHNADDFSAGDSRSCIYEAIRGIGESATLLAIVVVPREWKRATPIRISCCSPANALVCPTGQFAVTTFLRTRLDGCGFLAIETQNCC